MNNAGENDQFVDSQGWLEPFRVFFDRSFPWAFSAALEMANNDEGKAAQLCAHSFAKAYSRWALLGRLGTGEAFIQRQLRRGAKRSGTTAPLLETGVGFKPWVYVSAVEHGTARKRKVRAVSGAGATAAFFLLAFPVVAPAPNSDTVSTRTGSETTTTTTQPVTTPPPTTLPSPVDRSTDSGTAEVTPEESDRSGFTLDLSGLPTSPDQIPPSNVASLGEQAE